MSDDDHGYLESGVQAENATAFDAGDAVAVDKRKKELDFKARTEREWWRSMLGSPVGRKALWDILHSSNFFETSFMATPAGFPDPNATFFNLGQQALGKRLFLDLLQKSVVDVEKMLSENHPDFMKRDKDG